MVETIIAFDTRTKKPMWLNTRWCFATSVYFLTSPLGLPGCYLSSRPKAMERRGLLHLSSTFTLYGIRLIKQGAEVAIAYFEDNWSDSARRPSVAPSP